ncbi:Rossmann-fold NAD(P)-binding domain-containing protein [Anditalea andensis]|uniref:NADH dehydrogenase n=1 Tax=Anditalea andensis TaxID=1048983 RepID=A0A074L116_9BACT|nr:NAD-dependent epimerase/dehydratase family protein [Anditalea andensis]KEO74150.1 NADH dehydrogenase [Anditalea andensis]
MKTAIVIGGTGLVGNELVKLLLDDIRYSKVLVFGRRSLGIKNEKLQEELIDFDAPDEWRHLVKGDVLFSALGTTMKKAGNPSAQYKVDYYYQYLFAEAAATNKVPIYVLVSAPGAKAESVIFYTRMKGTLERDVKKLNFESMHFIQPGLLHGDRDEKRAGEHGAYVVLKAFNTIGLFRSYRPIDGQTVAKAMINASLSFDKHIVTYTLGEVFHLAGE